MLLLSSADFFLKILSGTLSECQTVWIQIRNERKSVLIFVQTVCKGYKRMAKVDGSKVTMKLYIIVFFLIFFKFFLQVFSISCSNKV